MAKLNDIINVHKNNIIYYWNNHLINTIQKKILFNVNPYNGKLEYLKNENTFYFAHKHNDICKNKKVKIYDNIGYIAGNAYKFAVLKDKLISFLNVNPLIAYNKFKQYNFIFIYIYRKTNILASHYFMTFSLSFKKNDKSWTFIFWWNFYNINAKEFYQLIKCIMMKTVLKNYWL